VSSRRAAISTERVAPHPPVAPTCPAGGGSTRHCLHQIWASTRVGGVGPGRICVQPPSARSRMVFMHWATEHQCHPQRDGTHHQGSRWPSARRTVRVDGPGHQARGGVLRRDERLRGYSRRHWNGNCGFAMPELQYSVVAVVATRPCPGPTSMFHMKHRGARPGRTLKLRRSGVSPEFLRDEGNGGLGGRPSSGLGNRTAPRDAAW
jgi:hypothetical protein